MDIDIWKDIEGFGGKFVVSSKGVIKRKPGVTCYKDGRKRFYPSRTMKFTKTNGYFVVALSANGKIMYDFVHRIVARAFIDNPNGKPNINHKDGIRDNNVAENLEWCTQSENVKHAYDVLGYMVTDDTKLKMSEAGKNKIFTAEHRKNLSLSQLGYKSHRAVKVYDLKTGKEYGCLKDYAREYNLNYHTLKGHWRKGLLSNLKTIKA